MSPKSKSTKAAEKAKKRKDVHVKVYFKTKAEKRALEAEAKKTGLKASSYLRNLAKEALGERADLAAERQLA